ncbi:hypothetical protein G9C85_02660 [Halorubellus sp. JP-L1]|uniref:hypothetical protein n=1 Tax=Halorubellus sp. JP-L1 TaxID=2715753 RepID=UPI00140A6A22|nr:hypothetical protein [Halorubellus sp. JP-L1]NHN40540.1 hypothetical protein [Halorubellus sp. JP-L1]
MTAPDVEWVLNRLGAVVDSVSTDYSLATEFNEDPVRLRRVDRDNSRLYDGSDTLDMSEPLHKRQGALEAGCYVGAANVDVAQSPIGTEFDLDVEHVVGVRLEGLHASKAGHVDPEGADGVPWEVLKQRVRSALYDQRTWPDAGHASVDFTHLMLANQADTSSNWRDFYRWDVDVVFSGFEAL